MICLLCHQPFSQKELFLNLILMRQSENNICPDCQKAFDKIGDKHCPNCYRKGVASQCQDCHKWEKEGHYVCHEALFTYNAAMKDYFSKYKFQGDMLLSHVFARDIKKALKKYSNYIFVPVPLSQKRFEERQFNQVTAFLQASQIPYKNLLIKRETDKQSDKNRKERLAASSPFILKDTQKMPKNILIIDDIYTTGATLKGIYHLFYKNGAKTIKSFTIAR